MKNQKGLLKMGTKILNCLTFSKDGLVMTNYGDDAIVAGNAGAVVSSTTLTSEQTINFLIDMSAVDVDKTVFIYPCFHCKWIST